MKFTIIFIDRFTKKKRTITAEDQAAAEQYARCQLRLWGIHDNSVHYEIEEVVE